MSLVLLSSMSRNAVRGSAAAFLVATRPWTFRRGGFDDQLLRRLTVPVALNRKEARQLSSAAVMEAVDALHNDTDDSNSLATMENPPPADLPPLLDPKELRPALQPPAALSPSSIAEFLACPQSFLFQYLYKLKQPTSLALLKGRLCHSALEQLYDLSPVDRNVTNLHNLFRKNYKELRDDNLHLFTHEISDSGGPSTLSSTSASVDERTWGLQALQLLTNYLNTEDATSIEPARREVWVSARFPRIDIDIHDNHDGDEDDESGVLRDSSISNGPVASLPKNRTFLVRGIVDRLDLARGYDSRPNRIDDAAAAGELDDDRVDPTVLGIVDYKTSQQPNLKYSPAMNRKIRDQSFFQLQIYALLLHEQQVAKQQERMDKVRSSGGDDDIRSEQDAGAERAFYLPVRFLRLMYLKSDHNRHADCWTLDLGSTPRIRKQALDATKQRLQAVYRDVAALVETQDPKAFVGCNRSFCYCHVCRPRFAPGSVWEPPVIK
jgi:PD-(D/E)XK nuclease superfamily